jgi:diguanylate cyclase (GGDEF)-like protein
MSQDLRSYKANILVVDDMPANLHLLSCLLGKEGYKVRAAINGKLALMAAVNFAPDLILLDIMMPDLNGYEVCKLLKANPKTADIPVIFLSTLDEEVDKTKAFDVGGIDYITKPINLEEVLTKIDYHLAFQAAEKEILRLNFRIKQRVKAHNHHLKNYNSKVARLLGDRLTGLPNRVSFLQSLEEALNQAKTDSDYRFAVLFLDCDRFKMINNSLGYIVGDELLKALARRLENKLSASDILARIGDDEFAILITEIPDINSATEVAERLLAALTHPFHLREREVFMSTSIGIAWSCPDYTQAEHMLRDADTAMCRAKELGKARYQIFNCALHEKACQFLQLETDLRQAIRQQEFLVYYQPIVNLSTGKIAGLEALLRWKHPTRGLVYPVEFIPVAEETGLITAIGYWVLRESCHQLRRWQKAKLVEENLTISVNVSAHQFTQPNLIKQIDRILAETNLNPQCLKLEITESALMETSQSANTLLQQLRDRQIQLSIDDFGIGYSSLSYLHSLPVNTLKVDKSFVQRLDGSSNNLGIVPAIIFIAQTMKMTVIAEGIETRQQLDQLRALNCHFSQGYLFSQPLIAEEVINLIASQPRW